MATSPGTGAAATTTPRASRNRRRPDDAPRRRRFVGQRRLCRLQRPECETGFRAGRFPPHPAGGPSTADPDLDLYQRSCPHAPCGADGPGFLRGLRVGADERHIATVDADGVALAAIQGLHDELVATRRELSAKASEVETLPDTRPRIGGQGPEARTFGCLRRGGPDGSRGPARAHRAAVGEKQRGSRRGRRARGAATGLLSIPGNPSSTTDTHRCTQILRDSRRSVCLLERRR